MLNEHSLVTTIVSAAWLLVTDRGWGFQSSNWTKLLGHSLYQRWNGCRNWGWYWGCFSSGGSANHGKHVRWQNSWKMEMLNNNQWMKCPVTHFELLSDLESLSIDDGVRVRDEWSREDNFPLKDPAILRMRVWSDGLSFDMMIVRRNVCVWNRGKIATTRPSLVLIPHQERPRLLDALPLAPSPLSTTSGYKCIWYWWCKFQLILM